MDYIPTGKHSQSPFTTKHVAEPRFRRAVKKMLVKVADELFQVHFECGLHVVKFHCEKQFEPVVDEWRVQQ